MTLPKISTSKDILPLMIFLTPFLMAITLPFFMSLALSPLKKDLAEAVSSAIVASTVGIVWPSLVLIYPGIASTTFA